MILKFKTYFSHLNRNKLRGEVAPHKPVLLLAIIDYVEEKLLTEEGREQLKQPIPFRPELQSKFNHRWTKHVHSEVFKPSFVNPIIHMQNEPFYHLIPYADRVYDGTHSMLAVESAFQGIQLDSELMLLIIQQDTRQQLKELLVGMV